MPQLPTFILLRSFFRSFALQASWNFDRLQSLGAVYVMAPALRFLFRDESRTAAFKRHLEYFNTHPFLAPAVLGTMLSLEGEASRGTHSEISATDFRGMIMAPYAAIGDALFWGGLRPLASATALFFAAAHSLWAPVVFLTVFNLPHLYFQGEGFWQGYRLGLDLIAGMQRRHLPDFAIRLKEVSVVLLGGLCAYLASRTLQNAQWSPGWGLFLLPLIFLLGLLVRKGASTLLLVGGMVALIVLLTWML